MPRYRGAVGRVPYSRVDAPVASLELGHDVFFPLFRVGWDVPGLWARSGRRRCSLGVLRRATPCSSTTSAGPRTLASR